MSNALWSIKSYKGRKINCRKPVEVYRNITAQRRQKGEPVYSVRQGGKIVAHAKAIMLVDCDFHVNEKGRQRVLLTQQKNVHAWVRGTPSRKGAMGADPRRESLRVKVLYDPRIHPYFQTVGFVPHISHVKSALAVCLNHEGMTAAYLEK